VAFTGTLLKQCLQDPLWVKTLPGAGLFLNVAPGQARTWNHLAQAVFQGLGVPPTIAYIPMPKHLEKQYQNFTQADLSTAHAYGLIHPWQSLEHGVSHCIQNHLLPQWQGSNCLKKG